MKIQTHEQEPNGYARVGRFAKVTRMVRELDYQLRTRGANPNHDPFGLLPIALERWTQQHWNQLALIAGARVPSAKTIALIIAEYRERAAAAAKLIETTGEELPVQEVA
jgi:hypothetical protein